MDAARGSPLSRNAGSVHSAGSASGALAPLPARIVGLALPVPLLDRAPVRRDPPVCHHRVRNLGRARGALWDRAAFRRRRFPP